jgi:type IX secretion system PorP/SprF family membrane protein
MKKFYLVILFFAIASMVKGQGEDPQISQYMFNIMSVNPGYAGSTDMVNINALNRNQWLGLEGAPKTYLFSADIPFNLFEKSHGAGISIVQDNIGVSKDLGLKLSYAYRAKTKIGDGRIGIGVSLGFYNSNTDFSKLTPSEPIIGGSTQKPNAFDMALGIYYKTEKVYMGISSTHLLGSELNFGSYRPWLIRTYYLTAGYHYQLPNPMLELVPSFLVQSNAQVSTLNFNTNIVYNNRFWGGLSYRLGAAVTGLIGFELLSGVRVSYSYDYETTDIHKASSNSFKTGSHELSVVYSFRLNKEKVPQKYKSIRFL